MKGGHGSLVSGWVGKDLMHVKKFLVRRKNPLFYAEIQAYIHFSSGQGPKETARCENPPPNGEFGGSFERKASMFLILRFQQDCALSGAAIVARRDSAPGCKAHGMEDRPDTITVPAVLAAQTLNNPAMRPQKTQRVLQTALPLF
ncbi:hypothetical protein ACKTEK_11035 [Tepidamorphus sp. 3E244]|uniref:hypothetical protein n=1 Tax=Tepidamorphus sp. 3E244 TaxID=3385498 RepID=UPI0038FCCF2E